MTTDLAASYELQPRPEPLSIFSTSAETPNDKLETGFSAVETKLSSIGGRYMYVSLLTGPARALFGCVQIVMSIAVPLLRVIFEMPFTRLLCGRNVTWLVSQEVRASWEYFVHGIGNIFRGAIEAACCLFPSTISAVEDYGMLYKTHRVENAAETEPAVDRNAAAVTTK